MQIDVFLALVVFAFVMAFTPGPNNILLTASGVNFGFVRTIPHLLGVDVGFVILLATFAAGLGLVFAAMPALQYALKVAGALYMLWLAWKVASARPVQDERRYAGPADDFSGSRGIPMGQSESGGGRAQRRCGLYAAGT